jgi:hypothetical protein
MISGERRIGEQVTNKTSREEVFIERVVVE